MIRARGRWLLAFIIILLAGPIWAADVDYSRDIRRILADRCYRCHGPDGDQREAELRLDTKEGALAKREGQPAVVPGAPKKSALITRIFSDDPDQQMPPPDSKLTLTQKEKEILRAWIQSGAEWDDHWAFSKPSRPMPPKARNSVWPINDIDRFILARLRENELRPSAQASKERLLRRVTLDLTGIPPTLKQIDAFLADKSPRAYEKVVDRLLASTSYGERMVWDWLDAARYADSNGFQSDPERTMWPWRDWVINALNSNMPFDQFTIEQLAGDLLPNATVQQRVATGFNRNHMYNGEGGRIPEETRVENVFDRVETTSTVWLGMTMTCSRCHDHKYDPFTQKEYYQLYAFFNNTSEGGGGRSGQIAPVVSAPDPQQTARLAELKEQLASLHSQLETWEKQHFPRPSEKQASESPDVKKLPKNVQNAFKQAPRIRSSKNLQTLISHFKKPEIEYSKLLTKTKKAADERDGIKKRIPRVMVMDEIAKARETFVLVRGTYNKPTDTRVTSETPAILPALPKQARRDRLALARWLVDPSHPLTARVTVNRYWLLFFGTGLVKTIEDFGSQGDEPSHPQLLDWLATEFIRSGWDVKALHKLIVMSATYRQQSHTTPELLERDPKNRLLSRGARYRLPSWMLRDQALALGSLLVEKVGGPPVKPYQPPGVWAESTFGKKRYQQDHGDKLYRRSVYTFWRRIIGPTMFFDVARRQTCTVKNSRTNTPLHALTTLNDVAYVEAARNMAQRVMKTNVEISSRVEMAFRMATARRPQPAELKILTGRYNKILKQFESDPEAAAKLLKIGESPRNEQLNVVEHAAFTALCSLILNLDETLSKE